MNLIHNSPFFHETLILKINKYTYIYIYISLFIIIYFDRIFIYFFFFKREFQPMVFTLDDSFL